MIYQVKAGSFLIIVPWLAGLEGRSRNAAIGAMAPGRSKDWIDSSFALQHAVSNALSNAVPIL
jgi:hypothetical protein